jgi:hypothetical protein
MPVRLCRDFGYGLANRLHAPVPEILLSTILASICSNRKSSRTVSQLIMSSSSLAWVKTIRPGRRDALSRAWSAGQNNPGCFYANPRVAATSYREENTNHFRPAKSQLALSHFLLMNGQNGKNSNGRVTTGSGLLCLVIPTNEELMIARETDRLVS